MAHLLEGHVPDGEFAEVGELQELREENERLQSENRRLRSDLIKAKADSEVAIAAITALRGQLGPLHRAMRAVFGEINLVVDEDAPMQSGSVASNVSAPSSGSPMQAAWQKWIDKFGASSNKGRFVAALLEHGQLTLRQLMVTIGTPRKQTIYDTYNDLNKLSLVRKNGDMYTLVS